MTVNSEKSLKRKYARIAAIDIGTVTTRLLVVDVFVQEGAKISMKEIYRDMRITHLGQGVNDRAQLSGEGMRAVLQVLNEYVQLLEHFQVDDVLCVATSAVRDAENAEQFIAAAAKIDVDIEVIPGQIEARLAFMGATYDEGDGGSVCVKSTAAMMKATTAIADGATLVVDIGGGSTELVLGCVGGASNAEILKLSSLQVGARRLTDMFLDSDPPRGVEIKGARKYLEMFCGFDLKKYVGEFDRLVAVAGTATTLAAVLGKIDPYNPREIQGYRVSRADLDGLLQLFLSKKLEQRQKICGLEPKRAGVIVAGTLIMEAIMDALDCEEFFASDRDLLYGIILSATKSALTRCQL